MRCKAGMLGASHRSAWDISTAVLSQSFSMAAQGGNPQSIFFKPDGMTLYVATAISIYQYDLGTAWDVATAAYAQFRSVSPEETSVTGIFFKPDGLKMYVIGRLGDDVNQYSLGTAWDIGTTSYAQNFSVAAQETVPEGVFFRPDGLKMYVTGWSDAIYEYDLSTAWDVTTAAYAQNFSAPFLRLWTDVVFRPDGLKMYALRLSGDAVSEYDLGVAWDVATAAYVQDVSVAAQETSPTGLFFKPDGLKMYITGTVSDSVHEYSLG